MKKFIAYFDYLGFKQFIENNDLSYQKSTVNMIFRDIESALSGGKTKDAPQGRIFDIAKSNINCINFSDTVVYWTNDDETPHTVTPDHGHKDGYSGQFGSDGVLKAGEVYDFLFTEEGEIHYHCQPHPWMKGELVITKQRF